MPPKRRGSTGKAGSRWRFRCIAAPRNRPPHSHAASEKLNSVVRVVQTGPPAPDFAASSRRACVPPFLRLDLIFREPYLAEAVISLNADMEGHHYSCGPQVVA